MLEQYGAARTTRHVTSPFARRRACRVAACRDVTQQGGIWATGSPFVET